MVSPDFWSKIGEHGTEERKRLYQNIYVYLSGLRAPLKHIESSNPASDEDLPLKSKLGNEDQHKTEKEILTDAIESLTVELRSHGALGIEHDHDWSTSLDKDQEVAVATVLV